MPSKKVLECSKVLSKYGLTISFAESATAGRLAADFALAPDSGKVLKGGIVCYDAGVKVDLLKVAPELINEYSPESAEVTEQLCVKLKALFKSDIYASITGLTTSGGSELPEKPIGTIFTHIIYKNKSVGYREVFKGSAERIILQAIDSLAVNISNLIKQNTNG